MRAGAGYVTALVPESLGAIFEVKLTEVMTVNLPDEGGRFAHEAADRVLEHAESAGALVLGPGMTRHGGAAEVGHRVVRTAPAPLVVDADGLNQHAGELDAFAGRPAPTVLTPHEHELGRLLGLDGEEVAAHRLACVRRAAEVAQAVVVLKGDDSLVARPDGIVAISPGGAPGLATAGTGDVLSGVIAAFLAKGMEPWHAAGAGVWAHVRAGQIAAERYAGAEGVIASDVIAALPHAVAG